MRILILICVMICIAYADNSPAKINIMPLPARVTITDGKYILDSTFSVSVNADFERLNKALTRFLRRLSGRTGLFIRQGFIKGGTVNDSASLIIEVQQQANLTLEKDESYRLDISRDKIKITAETDIGAMYAMETLLQLLSVADEIYYFPTVHISDQPRFPWRGLMIDASRHFMPVDVIKRNLDGMLAVKLNVFHWHLSDDQGFRVESKVFPNLQLKASDGFYYTQAQVRDVVAYADDRGIRVVPEFDVPGHATALILAYPKLGSGPVPKSIERKWGIFYPALNPASEYTYTFLDKLFKEMASLFPDKYFHIGGDELESADHQAVEWNENKEIRDFMQKKGIKNNVELQAYFNSRILKSLVSFGKIMVGWDEILHENMPMNIIIQSWRGKESMVKAARQGYQSILSNGYYIDLIYPARDHYLNDPLPDDIDLNNAQKKLILGGEATMWSEYVSPETIDSRIWPRTAAIAERLWSPGSVKDVHDMYRRLDVISYQLEELGLTHIKNYEMLLRRLTGNQDIQPLKTLVDVLEPLKHYERGKKRPYNSFSPLTRVVDAARPDSKTARDFNALVDNYLNPQTHDTQTLNELKSWLKKWNENHTKLEPVIEKSPVLKEIEPLSKDLSDIAGIALQAVDMNENKKRAPDQWLESNMKVINQAGRSHGQTELMVVNAIKRLVQAGGSLK